MSVEKYPTFKPVKPHFDLVRGALGDLVDGEHFLDCGSEKIAYEVRYDFPGWLGQCLRQVVDRVRLARPSLVNL
jgi:hypothetical protein